MTCIIGTWDVDGTVILGADSQQSGSRRPAMKLWYEGHAIIGGAGDASLIRWLQDHPAEGLSEADAAAWCWAYLERLRSRAGDVGLLRDGVQGTRFTGTDLLVGLAGRLFVLYDGVRVEEIQRSDAVVAIGDPTAGEAAYFAAIAGGATPGEVALEMALRAVCRVSADVGGPIVVRRALSFVVGRAP